MAHSGLRSGSRERDLFTSPIFGRLWSRTRIRDASASGRGTPPRGSSGEPGGRSGPDHSRPRPSSEGPGGGPNVWHDQAGTTINPAIRMSTTAGGTTSATASPNAGTERQPIDTRAQKCGRRPIAQPACTDSMTNANSAATNKRMITVSDRTSRPTPRQGHAASSLLFTSVASRASFH